MTLSKLVYESNFAVPFDIRTVKPSTIAQRQKDREKIANDIEEYIKRGGMIKSIEYGVTGREIRTKRRKE